jgi:hypothetical protein
MQTDEGDVYLADDGTWTVRGDEAIRLWPDVWTARLHAAWHFGKVPYVKVEATPYYGGDDGTQTVRKAQGRSTAAREPAAR